MTASKVDAQSVSARLKTVTDYVRDCERRVGLGEIMDLQGLDQNVIELCDAIGELEQDDAKELEKKLATLIEGLETLARAMKEQQERMGG